MTMKKETYEVKWTEWQKVSMVKKVEAVSEANALRIIIDNPIEPDHYEILSCGDIIRHSMKVEKV